MQGGATQPPVEFRCWLQETRYVTRIGLSFVFAHRRTPVVRAQFDAMDRTGA